MGKIKRIIKGGREKLQSAWKWLFNWHGLKRGQTLFRAFVLILFVGLAYFLFSLIFISPGQLSWLRLRQSWQSEAICHEACWARRRAWQADIVSRLSSGDRQLSISIKEYLESGPVSVESRQELVKLLALAFGPNNPPDYLVDMIDEAEPDLQAAYYSSFHPQGLLAAPYYVSLAADSSQAMPVRLAALASLSGLPEGNRRIDSNQLAILGGLALSAETEAKLRQRLVLVLTDYYSDFPELVPEILKKIYASDSLADDISRAFAADWLNRLSASSSYPLPPVSEAQWQDYYNN